MRPVSQPQSKLNLTEVLQHYHQKSLHTVDVSSIINIKQVLWQFPNIAKALQSKIFQRISPQQVLEISKLILSNNPKGLAPFLRQIPLTIRLMLLHHLNIGNHSKIADNLLKHLEKSDLGIFKRDYSNPYATSESLATEFIQLTNRHPTSFKVIGDKLVEITKDPKALEYPHFCNIVFHISELLDSETSCKPIYYKKILSGLFKEPKMEELTQNIKNYIEQNTSEKDFPNFFKDYSAALSCLNSFEDSDLPLKQLVKTSRETIANVFFQQLLLLNENQKSQLIPIFLGFTAFDANSMSTTCFESHEIVPFWNEYSPEQPLVQLCQTWLDLQIDHPFHEKIKSEFKEIIET